MKYYLNPTAFGAAFSVPSVIADNYLKLATHNELRVILYVLRHSCDGVDIEATANALNISADAVLESLMFWADRKVLLADGVKAEEEPARPVATEKNIKPTRLDVANRGLEDENISRILQNAQMKFGRSLKTNESSTLVYIYDDLGLDASVIFLLFQYACDEGKLNIRFIEKTAVNWANLGVKTIVDAEKVIEKTIVKNLSWKRVSKAFGIESRKPSEKEIELSTLWIDTYNLSEEYLTLAYDVCIDNKTKLSFAYVAKVIENWRKENLETAEDVKKYLSKNTNSAGGKKKKYDYAGYDIELYEKSLDTED